MPAIFTATPLLALSGLVLLSAMGPAAQVAQPTQGSRGSEIWEQFARRHYLGGDNLGHEFYRGSHLKNERAPNSWVGSSEHQLSDGEAADVQRLLSTLEPPDGAAILPDYYLAWSGKQEEEWILVTFCSEVDLPEKGQIDVYFGNELRRIAAYADRLDVAVWLRGGDATVVRSDIRLGAGKEMDVCPSWEPFDVVDIDQDGDPEVVLLARYYEGHRLQILTIRGSVAILRWEGLGSGL